MFYRTVFFLGVLFWGLSAYAGDFQHGQQVASLAPDAMPAGKAPAFAHVLGGTRAPLGWLQFCETNAWECTSRDSNETVQLSNPKKQELMRINAEVNKDIEPVTDAEHYGVTEKWSYPDDGRGDCEDYALLKRHKLMERGWPASSLLITVVRDGKNEGHAVLTVHTSAGDLILDNVHDDIRAWFDTGYRFVKRQSQADINQWVSLTDHVGADQAVAAGR
jgi:predicted transglutaminase-like cysteine proteinase